MYRYIRKYIEINIFNKLRPTPVSFLFKIVDKFVLKQFIDLEFTVSEGKEFHSRMDLGKKENLTTSLKIWAFYT